MRRKIISAIISYPHYKLNTVTAVHFAVYIHKKYELMHFLFYYYQLVFPDTRMFRRLMSPSSGPTYCEDHSMSTLFVTKVLDKVVHINSVAMTLYT
jgi:hypothetical protein